MFKLLTFLIKLAQLHDWMLIKFILGRILLQMYGDRIIYNQTLFDVTEIKNTVQFPTSFFLCCFFTWKFKKSKKTKRKMGVDGARVDGKIENEGKDGKCAPFFEMENVFHFWDSYFQSLKLF